MTASLPGIALARPHSLADAIAARQQHPRGRFLAGGTDLIVGLRHGISRADTLIDITGIDELCGIDLIDGRLRIGAAVTIAAVAADPLFATRYRAVAEAAQAVGGPGHRALGTVGGNLCLDTRCLYYNQSDWWRRANGYCLKHRGDICHVAPQGERCHAAFTGDLAPALMVLGAEVEIAGPHGRRREILDQLYVEDGLAHLTLADSELIVAVHLPQHPPASGYRKVRLRGAIDYPLAGVAVALERSDEVLVSLRIAMTGTNSRPFALAGTDAIVGRPLDEGALQAIERLVQKQVQPMRTTLASSHYRRLAGAALARRLVAELFAASHDAGRA